MQFNKVVDGLVHSTSVEDIFMTWERRKGASGKEMSSCRKFFEDRIANWKEMYKLYMLLLVTTNGIRGTNGTIACKLQACKIDALVNLALRNGKKRALYPYCSLARHHKWTKDVSTAADRVSRMTTK